MKTLGRTWIWGLALLFLYLFPLTTSLSGDTLASVFSAASWSNGQFGRLDDFPIRPSPDAEPYYWAVPTQDGGFISGFGMGMPLLIAPFHALNAMLLGSLSFDAAVFWGKFVAALCVVVAFALMKTILSRITRPGLALLLSLAYALGTGAYGVASQEPWQHAANQWLYLGVVYLLLFRVEENRALWLAGVLAGFAVLVRPTNLLILVPLLLWFTPKDRRMLGLFLPLAFFAAVQAGYNFVQLGSPFSFGQDLVAGASVQAKGVASPWNWNPLPGFLGLLISPARGLFVFSPFLLLLLGLRSRDFRNDSKTAQERPPLFAAALFVSLTLLVLGSFRWEWWAGLCWGARYLADAAPFLVLLLVPVFERLKSRAAWSLAIFLIVISVFIQSEGAMTDLYGPKSWNSMRLDKTLQDRDSLWRLTPPPPIWHHLSDFQWDQGLTFTRTDGK